MLATHDVSFPPLVEATFLERPHRFLLWATVDKQRVAVASRDPGRLEGLLSSGTRLLVAPGGVPPRRTAYTLMLTRHRGIRVSMVPVLANRIVQSALTRGAILGFEAPRILAREVVRGASRFDFLLMERGRPLILEVKSATLVEGGRDVEIGS